MRFTLIAFVLILAIGATASDLAAQQYTFFEEGGFCERPESLDFVLDFYALVKAEPRDDIVYKDGPYIWGHQLTALTMALGTGQLSEADAHYAIELVAWATGVEGSEDPEKTEADMLTLDIPLTITWVQYRDLQTLRRAWTAEAP